MALVTLGSLAIGSIVKFNVDNSLREFIVVHRGKPSSIYDDSFNDTTMLLSRFRHENRAWQSSAHSDYANSDIQKYLNDAFLNSIDAQIRSQIVQVKVPYRPGSAYWSATVNSGANGLSTKIFLLSGYELNWTTTSDPHFPADGATLSYFVGTALKDMKRSVGANYWLRSAAYGSNTGLGYRAWGVNDQGAYIDTSVTTSSGVRPALALPNSLFVTDDGILITNQPPTDPTGLFYAAPNAGRPVTISWTASTDPDEGDTIQYVVERRVDNGVFHQTAITPNAFYTDACPTGGTYYQVRVKAVDDKGNESGYITGTSLPINYNNPPEITGEDIDWGALTQPQSYDYTPSDPDEGNILTVVEQVTNGSEVFTLRAFTAESGQKYTADFSSVWMLLAKGSHALVITVDDGQGGEATRTITFSRPVQRIAASRAFSTDEPVTQTLISIYPGLPADASLHLEVCNNPFDDSPAWEDITAKVGKYVHAFESVEAVNGPGLAYKLSITPGAMPVHFDMAVIRFKHGGEEYVYQG